MKKARKTVKEKIKSQYKPSLKNKIAVKKQRIGVRDIARKMRPLNDTEKMLLDKELRKLERAFIYGEGLNRIDGGFANAKMTDSDRETIDVTLTWGVKNDKVDYSYPKELVLDRKTMEVIKGDNMEKGGAIDGKYQVNDHGDKPTDYKILCRIIRTGGKDVQVCYHERNDHKEKGVEVYSGKNYIVGSKDVSYSKKYDELSEVPVKYKAVVDELIEAHHDKWGCGCSEGKHGTTFNAKGEKVNVYIPSKEEEEKESSRDSMEKGGKTVYNVTYFDKDGEELDSTQIDEKDEKLAWDLFKEFGHDKKPDMYLEWEKTTEEMARGGVIKKTYLPDEVEHRGKTYVRNASLSSMNMLGQKVDMPKDYIIVEVLSKNLKGKRDLHGQFYTPTKWIFVPKEGSSMEKGGSIPNNYRGKSAHQVWSDWSKKQREHFLRDHDDVIRKIEDEAGRETTDLSQFASDKYDELPITIQNVLAVHIVEGQYSSGGSMEKGGGIDTYEEWKAIDAPHPLKYRAYKLKEGHFKITAVDESGEYQLGYTSSPYDFIKETAAPYKIKKYSGGSMEAGGNVAIKENPLLDRINSMEGSADDKLNYLKEYQNKYKLSGDAEKNVEKIRAWIVRIRENERKKEKELKKYTPIPVYKGSKDDLGSPTDETQMDKWIAENIDNVPVKDVFEGFKFVTDNMKAKHLKGLYFEYNKLGSWGMDWSKMEAGGLTSIVDNSGVKKIHKLGLTDSSQFGDKYRDWLTKVNRLNNNGEYVGYQLSTHRDTITVIGKKGTVDFEIEDYDNFPKSAKPMRAAVVHYEAGGEIQSTWDNWTGDQRFYFLSEHGFRAFANSGKKYDELDENIKSSLKSFLEKHPDYVKTYFKGGKAKNEKVITFSNSSHTSTKASNRKAWDELNEKLLNDKKNPLYNEFQREDILLDTTDGGAYIPIVYSSMQHPKFLSETKIKRFLDYLKGFVSMESHVYIGDHNYKFNNYLKPTPQPDDEEYFDEDEYAKGGKINNLKSLIKKEIENQKNEEYDNTDESEQNQLEIINMAERDFGYDYEQDDDAFYYFLKATPQEIWKYWIDVILPKLEKKKIGIGEKTSDISKKAEIKPIQDGNKTQYIVVDKHGVDSFPFRSREKAEQYRDKLNLESSEGSMEKGGAIDDVSTPEEFKEWAAERKLELIDELGGFHVGDKVRFTNPQGVVFEPRTIIGIGKDDSFYNRRFYLNNDSYWFPHTIEEIEHYKGSMYKGGRSRFALSDFESMKPYYEVAKKAEANGLIKNLSEIHPPDEDGIIGEMFSFRHIKDKCDVTIFYDPGYQGITMSQDYNDGNPLEDDDISLEGFREYVNDNKKWEGGSMAVGGVIGDNKAKDIVKHVLAEAKKENVSLPQLQKFADEGAKAGNLLEAYEEFSKHVNNGSAPKPIRLNYEDSNKFYHYVTSFFPNKVQRSMYDHYGKKDIERNFPNYSKGGSVKDIPILKKDATWNDVKKYLQWLGKSPYQYHIDDDPKDVFEDKEVANILSKNSDIMWKFSDDGSKGTKLWDVYYPATGGDEGVQERLGMEKGGMASDKKVEKVMHEFKHGKLKSHGKTVTDRQQAVAIAMSESGQSRKDK